MTLIDRDELIKEIREAGETMIFSNASQHRHDDEKREFAIYKLLEAPVIDTIRHGHWIIKFDHGVYTVCSCCDCYTQRGFDDEEENNRLYITSDYCPNCGAIMEVDE